MPKNNSGFEEEGLTTHVIPENFVATGRCFNGMFRTRNLIEGAVFAAPFAYLITHLDLVMNQKIVLTVVVAGSVLALCILGINGDSVVEFFAHFFTYRKKKRVAKYNPRVKTEAMPGYLTKENGELPRDKILRVINEINKRGADNEEAVSRDIYDPMYREFFADDLGYVEVPDDLKTKKELRQEAKERKRLAAEEARCAKRKAKEAAAHEKKEKRQKAKEEKAQRKKEAKASSLKKKGRKE